MNSGFCSFPAGSDGLLVTEKKENVPILAERSLEEYKKSIINKLPNLTKQSDIECYLPDVEFV